MPETGFVLHPSSFNLPAALPSVTCLCPTYGRFERLRDAVACFLLQDYPGARRLLILNDATAPIRLASARNSELHPPYGGQAQNRRVDVFNAPARFATLGHKRQALLDAAQTPLVAHWDDDDIYLPWHLTMLVCALLGRPWPPAERFELARRTAGEVWSFESAQPETQDPEPETFTRRSLGEGGPNPEPACVKPRAAWWGVGVRECFEVRGPCHNVFEGQMLFDRERALELGGYPPQVSGQARALLGKFRNAGELHTWNPADRDISYVYRWADGLHHISGSGDNRASHDGFGEKNRDFGAGEPLIPSGPACAGLWARARLAGQFRNICAAVAGRLSKCSEDEQGSGHHACQECHAHNIENPHKSHVEGAPPSTEDGAFRRTDR